MLTGIILSLYFLVLIIIGIYSKRYTKDINSFAIGNRNLGIWAAALSFSATNWSSTTILGNAGMGYLGGMGFLAQPILPIICVPLGILVLGWATRKTSEALGVSTVPGLFRARFNNNATSLICTVVITVFLIPFMVAIIIAAALGIEMLTGWSYTWSVISVSIISGVYISIGGFMATVYSGIIQGIWMLIGNVWLFSVLLFTLGGPQGIYERLSFESVNLISVPGVLGWEYILLHSFVWSLAPWGMPHTIQKWFAFKDKRVVFYSAMLVSVFAGIIIFTSNANGVMARALLGNQLIEKPDMAFPIVVIQYLPQFFSILLLTTVLSASLSTIDSLLHICTTIMTKDVYQKYASDHFSNKNHFIVSTITIAILITITTWGALKASSYILTLAAFSASVIASTILPSLVYALFWKNSNAAGSIAAQIGGCLICLLWYLLKSPFGVPPILVGLAFGFTVLPLVSMQVRCR